MSQIPELRDILYKKTLGKFKLVNLYFRRASGDINDVHKYTEFFSPQIPTK